MQGRQWAARAKGIVAAAVLALVASIGVSLTWAESEADPAVAVPASAFNPGNIIADDVFYNGAAMSVGDVQAFLNSKVDACRAGYVCLKDYAHTTTYKPADRYCAGYHSGWQTAAQIIEGVGRSCRVSQKVLLVLLEKEQALVTDTWPVARQYRSATGYGCPDTADCDAEYYGFFNQVYHAARQYWMYRLNAADYRYQAGRTNYIQYNPNASCGGSNVYIENQATAGLYIYTPYQPNASALANFYGSGDSCGAYGNRNFFRIYSDWFGSTQGWVVSGGIGAYYNYLGGADRNGLGFPVGDQYQLGDGGWVQHFQGGQIYWSPTTNGIRAVGGIGIAYTAAGGPIGTGLGYPTAEQVPLNDRVGGWVQRFQRGSIYWSPARGAVVVKGEMSSHYEAVGGINSALGYPVRGWVALSGGGYQDFEGGRVYAANGQTPRSVAGDFSTASDAVGGVGGSSLGYPTGDRSSVPGGAEQRFQRGAVYASAAGSYAVPGGIGLFYVGAGGPVSSGFGFPTGPQYPLVDGGWAQAFVNGTVFYKSGANHFVPNALLAEYLARGGPVASGLGYPTGPAVSSGGTTSQTFAKGSINSDGKSVRFIFNSSSDQQYYDGGGPAGPLGQSFGPRVEVDSARAGWYQQHTNGTIYGSAATSARRVSGGIGEHFARAGGVTVFGYPVSEQYPLKDSAGGWQQEFEKATIYWSPATGGVHATAALARGLVRWGGPAVAGAGYPSGTEVVTSEGRYQPTRVGGVFARDATGTWVVGGGIGEYYMRSGGPASRVLGWPVGPQVNVGDGAWLQRFERGTITWTAATGAQTLSGGVGADYFVLGGAIGTNLGYPTGAQREIVGAWTQQFQRGSVYWTAQRGLTTVFGGIGEAHVARGGATGSLGLPASPAYQVFGGWLQEFVGGRLYWSPSTGGRAAQGGIGSAFIARGGPSGSGLGFPTGDQIRRSDGNYTQYFQRGRIEWTPASGSRFVL